MRAWIYLAIATALAGCALEVSAPPSEPGALYDAELTVESKAAELRMGGSGAARVGSKLGWNPPNCSSCYDQYLDCLDDAGGDAELNDLCRWESDVCHKHCSGPIIAIQ